MTTVPPKVRVGVGVFVLASAEEPHDNPYFLVGKRINTHGAGTYALPGGHLEFGESFEECAVREVTEETGLKVKNTRYLTLTNDVMEEESKHYVTIFMVCEREDSNREAEVLEPDKCEGWTWWSWEELLKYGKGAAEVTEGEVSGKKLFIPLLNLVKEHPDLRLTI